MYCSKCGTQNKEGSKFCRSCGTSLQKNKPINQERKQIKQHKANQKVVKNSTQRLGSSNDFYTYLTAGMIVLSLLMANSAIGFSIILVFIPAIFWVIGLKKTTNIKLHFGMLVFILLVFVFLLFKHNDMLVKGLI